MDTTDRRQDNPNIRPLIERRREPQPPMPVWRRRALAGLDNGKDMTGQVKAA